MSDQPQQPDEPGSDQPGFASLGLRPEVLQTLNDLGYEEPTPIQTEAIPPMIAGRDLLGQAATGTGKTAAFALPILERIVVGARAEPLALVLVPTRELAIQVSEAIYRYGRRIDAQVLPVYGGQPIVRQLAALKRGVHVVVATPGRARDHLARHSLPLDAIELVVLDEADEMLDMGFAEDIEAILAATPPERQTVLFSATMPPRINSIARRHLNDPVRIELGRASTEPGEAPLVRQRAFVVARAHKAAALGRVLDVEMPSSAIVFCRTRNEVDQLTETLNGRGYRAEALHGGMNQEQRDRVMGRMRNGSAELLIATDVAARGLDLDQLSHVVNFDVPSAPESYVHRIGRVGRAGREGVAITLAEPRERRLIANIERVTRQKLILEPVPSVADLRARQMEQLQTALREHLEADDRDRFDGVVDELSQEFDPRDVALAAVRMAQEATGVVADEAEIPEAYVKPERTGRPERPKGGQRADRPSGGGRPPRPNRAERQDRSERSERPRQRDDRDHEDSDVAKLYVGVGRSDGVRPQDLVGAFAGETNLTGRDIGAITITERFSIVEVPAAAADSVIADMSRTTIRGRKAGVRYDRH